MSKGPVPFQFKKVARLLKLTGLDNHARAMLLQRLWSVIAGAITVFLIPSYLSPIQQGYYFSFSSILGLQVFFELGMGQVVVQIVAHEAAHLKWTKQKKYDGNLEVLARIVDLRHQLDRWYRIAAILFFLIATTIGLKFFRSAELVWSEWGLAWIIVAQATSINLYLSWKLSVIEGFGLIENISTLRFQQSVIGYFIFWGALILKIGLISISILPLVSAVATVLWVERGQQSKVLSFTVSNAPLKPLRWISDIFPLQWRIGLSWISGYFVFQMFTPFAFKKLGANEAGCLGLALTIFSAIGLVGLTWVNAKSPAISMMIARGESELLLKESKKTFLMSIGFTVIASSFFLAAVVLARVNNLEIANRIAALPVLITLAVVTVINNVIFASAIFMRAHREEPMLAVSIVSGLSIMLVVWLGSSRGSLQMMIGYLLVTSCISLPWTINILRRYIYRHIKIYSI
jgi:hypothetical protein